MHTVVIYCNHLFIYYIIILVELGHGLVLQRIISEFFLVSMTLDGNTEILCEILSLNDIQIYWDGLSDWMFRWETIQSRHRMGKGK